jgi:hypothetical protein
MQHSITIIHLPTALIDRSQRIDNDLADFIEYASQQAAANPSSWFAKRLAAAFPFASWTNPDPFNHITPEDLQLAASDSSGAVPFLVQWASPTEDLDCYASGETSFWSWGESFEQAAELADEIARTRRRSSSRNGRATTLLQTLATIFD